MEKKRRSNREAMTKRHRDREKRKKETRKSVQWEDIEDTSQGEETHTKEERDLTEGRFRTRGRVTTDAREKINTDLKIHIFDRRKGQKTTRMKVMELLTMMKIEDKSAVLFVGDDRVQEEAEVPEGKAFRESFKQEEARDGSIYLRATMETRLRLHQMKWKGTGKLMQWLKDERVMVQMDRWKTERARVVGCVLLVHPTLTWKPDYKEELKEQLESVSYTGYEKTEWMKKVGRSKDRDIPDFQVLHERKGFGTGEGRVVTTVLSIEARVEDSLYLKELLRAAMRQQQLRGVFIEAGYHLSASPRRMVRMLSNQNKFLNGMKMIPLMGVKEEVMEKVVEKGGITRTVREHLLEFLGVERIERTSQTGRLGKWILLCQQIRYQRAVERIDRKAREFFHGIVEDGERVEGFVCPRRPNGPTIDLDHEEYLLQVELASGVFDGDEGGEVTVVQQDNQETGRQRSNSRRPPEKRAKGTYAEVTRQTGSDVNTQVGDSRTNEVQGDEEGIGVQKEEDEKGRDVEQVAREIDEEMRRKLLEQEEKMERMYLRTKTESNKLLEEMLARFRNQMTERADQSEANMISKMGGMIEGVMKELRDLKHELSEIKGGEKGESGTMTRTKTATRPTTRTRKTTPATTGTRSPIRK